MNLDPGTTVAAPTLLPRKRVSVDLPKMFIGILSAVPTALMTSQTPAEGAASVASAVLGSMDAITIETPLPDRAWRLIYRSLGIAFAELATEAGKGTANLDDVKTVLEALRTQLESTEVTINDSFFRNPVSLSLVGLVESAIRRISEAQGMSESEASIYASRFPAYFVSALHSEWIRGQKEYDALLSATTSPFMTPTRSLREKIRYAAWLKKQVSLPVFEETFSLKDVYVPLRGYFERGPADEECDSEDDFTASGRPTTADSRTGDGSGQDDPVKVVVDVTATFADWIVRAEKTDAIRVLSGGPGSGKSSILKMLAADLSDLEHIYPVYVPLQRISITDDLCVAVVRFLKESGLYGGDIFQDARESSGKVVLFLDGLDELTKPGDAAETMAQDFLLEVQRTLHVANTMRVSVVAVVSGRTIAVQKTRNVLRLKKSTQFSVMRYAYQEHERAEYDDPGGLLAEDQRITWWEKYAKAKGLSSKIPNRLIQADISELSTEPLLNYLLVLSGYHLRPRGAGGVNRNEVYRILLAGVHSRGYEDGGYQPTQALTDDEFELIMETIAVAAWYGDSRTASVEDIRSRCTTPKLKTIFDRFVAGGGGVTRLIAAFYFQAADKNPNGRTDEAFEFTHKSFGEYLTARRLVRALDRLAKELLEDQSERETPVDEASALKSWAALSGAAPVDGDLARFIRDEVRMPHWRARVSDWLECSARMINRALVKGIPVELAAPASSMAIAAVSRNSEESLWCMAGACASALKRSPPILWPDDKVAGALLHRVRSQRWPDADSVLLSSLNYVDFSNQNLVVQDMFSARLVGARFVKARLIKAEMQACQMTDCDLSDTALSGIDLSTSHLERAKFDASNGTATLMESIMADGASFRQTHYVHLVLTDSSIDDCDFRASSVRSSDLAGSSARRSIFDGVQWADVDLTGCDLESASFVGGNFERCVFDRCNLDKVDLSEATFVDCSFAGVFLSDETLAGLEDVVGPVDRDTEGTFARGREYARMRHSRRLSSVRMVNE